MKKIYHVYKNEIELENRKLNNLLKFGMSYLYDIEKYDYDPQIEKSFDTYEEAKKYLDEHCSTTISGIMGSGVRYREIEYYTIWEEYWLDGNENEEDSDGMSSNDITPVEAYTYLKISEYDKEESCYYIYEDEATEDAKSEYSWVENEDDVKVYLVKYVDGEETERKEIEIDK